MRRIVVGLSGASGAIYGIRVLEALRNAPAVETHLVISSAACRTIELETDYSVAAVQSLADRVYAPGDIGAAIASGSFRAAGMAIVPCSMKTLSAVAHSLGDNLLARAADVTLKERRRLVIVPRETPLHLGHLRLMTEVTEMGAVVAPPMPAFYNRPQTIDELVNQTVSRVLDLLDVELPQDLARRWDGVLPLAVEAQAARPR